MFNTDGGANPLPPTDNPLTPASLSDPGPPPRTCDMTLYKPGKSARWQGMTMTISHVLLRKGRLLVYLEGHPEALEPEALDLPPTRLVLQRS